MRRLGVIGLVVLWFIGFSGVSPASANWYGVTGIAGTCVGGNITDNHDMYFTYEDTHAAVEDAATWVRNNLLNPTDLNTYMVASQGDHTDVVVLDRYYTDYCNQNWSQDGWTGILGYTTCEARSSTDRCDKQVVRISDTVIDWVSTNGDRELLCHEIGHAIGLGHRSAAAGCMYQPFSGEELHYTSHDRDHINANWETEPRQCPC
jgi:hypothetical protein